MARFRWSATSLSLYLRCPHAYWLRYREKIMLPVPPYLTFGSAVHKAIRICHRGNPHQFFQPTAERPLFFESAQSFGNFWCSLWAREIAQAEKTTGITWRNRDEEFGQYLGLGRKLLAGTKDDPHSGYYNTIFSLPIEILEVEFRINTDLWGYPFTAIIDQIWRTEGGIAIVDFTSGKHHDIKYLQTTVYDQCLRQWRRRDPQAKQRFAGEIAHFVWSLRDNQRIPTAPQNPTTLLDDLEFAARNIEAGHFPQTQQDQGCRYCEYQTICDKTVGQPIPAGDGGQLTVSLPERQPPRRNRQLGFRGGAEGGWFRGGQVRGQG